MIVSIIAAIGNSGQLGLHGKIPWKVPGDLLKFKLLTNGHCVLMGRKTFESLGKPLKNRTNLIVSRRGMIIEVPNTFTFTTLYKAVAYAESIKETELFIIGGAEIYSSFINNCDKMYISTIDYNQAADTFFPIYDISKFTVMEEETNMDSIRWTHRLLVKNNIYTMKLSTINFIQETAYLLDDVIDILQRPFTPDNAIVLRGALRKALFTNTIVKNTQTTDDMFIDSFKISVGLNNLSKLFVLTRLLYCGEHNDIYNDNNLCILDWTLSNLTISSEYTTRLIDIVEIIKKSIFCI